VISMQPVYKMEVEDQPGSPQAACLRQRLKEFNNLHVQDDCYTPLNIILKDDTGEIAGGLAGGTYWDWLSIDILWVREDARRLGYGAQILAAAEAEAVTRGCRRAHVDTHDFQAPGFYLKQGYIIWGTLHDLPPGHQRIYLRKDLLP